MQISREFSFCAAHWLPRHTGKASRLHGHNYLVRIELDGAIHPHSQFVIDPDDLNDIVQPTIDLWDHRLLNAFIRYSTAENVAAHLAHIVRAKLQIALINRLVVAVSETPRAWAIWDSRNKEDLMMLDRAQDDAEWKSPDIKIPIEVLSSLESAIVRQDEQVVNLLRALTQESMVREQYALYKATLIEHPVLPASVRRQDIQ